MAARKISQIDYVLLVWEIGTAWRVYFMVSVCLSVFIYVIFHISSLLIVVNKALSTSWCKYPQNVTIIYLFLFVCQLYEVLWTMGLMRLIRLKTHLLKGPSVALLLYHGLKLMPVEYMAHFMQEHVLQEEPLVL